MTAVEKPHFSNPVLRASERARDLLWKSRIGRALDDVVSGSSSPAACKLSWSSLRIEQGRLTGGAIEVPKDPHAGILPRGWTRSVIIAAELEELDWLYENAGSEPQHQAVGYIAKNTLHVGFNPEGSLFDQSDKEAAVAMRLGRGSLIATMGLWLPGRRYFAGVTNPKAVETNFPIGALHTQYPSVRLAC